MTRKYLGIDENMTVLWLVNCINCKDCLEQAVDSTEYNTGSEWDALKQHVAFDHQDEEFCLTCHIWIEDVEFPEHLWNKHARTWKGMNSPLYKEFELDES